MKIFDVEIPADLEIPELDDKEKARLDALQEEIVRDRAEQAERIAKSPFRDLPRRSLSEEEPARFPPETINIEALRKLPIHVRSIVLYFYKEHVTY